MPSASRGSTGTVSGHARGRARRRCASTTPAATPPTGRRACSAADEPERLGGGQRPHASRWCAARGASCACCSCSSWTVHSTSESPPRPSLRWVLRSAPRGQPLGLHARLEGADLAHLAVVEPALGVPQRVDELEEPLAQVRVAGHRRGPQQRLGLPRERPAAVVLAVGLERAHERAALALRAQVGVDVEGRVRARAARAAGELLDHLERLGLGLLRRRRPRPGRARRARRRRCRSPAPRPRAGPSRRRAGG